ncbi:hypothetical protein ISS03_01405 [Patescibacteria group bacterium]|nr:hypothetical protein [Patescibacteria group bacterium]
MIKIVKHFFEKYNLNSQKGTSFIEMLLYVAIMALVLISMVAFSLSIHSSYVKNYVSQQVHDNLRVALYYITTRIKLSNGLNETNSLLDVDPGVLYLNTFDPFTNPIVFSLDQDDGSLYLSEGVSVPLPVTSDEIQFTKFIFSKVNSKGRDSIRIVLRAEAKGDTIEHRYAQEIYTTVSLRY